jgi:TPR repeat protein
MGISYYNKTQLENNQELALYWLRLSAEQGYAPAQWRLGDIYALDGQTAMVELYIKSALQGDTNALKRINSWKNDTSLFEKLDSSNQLFLAFCYHHEFFGIRKNKNHATLLYQKSPLSSDAQYQLGLLFCQNKQFQKARSSFEKAACDEKKTAAVNQLAFLYENVLVNTGDNLGKAIELYTRIATMDDQCDQAVLDAKINLARIYRKMNSIDNAITWYTKALDTSQTEWTRPHQIAKSCLDQLLNQPPINSKYRTLSSRLRQSIAEVSDPEIQSQLKQIGLRALRRDGAAMYQVSTFYGQGTYFKENQHVSFLWLKNAASVGQCKEAQFSLGKIIHHQGDTKSFIKWYTRAANQGHVEAQYSLGIHYTSLENLKEAYKWLSMAASQNYSDAHYQLGLLCFNHQGLPFECDPMTYFEKAAHQKHVGAIYQLGLCYFEGIGGVQMDRDIGITYYEYCASKDFGDASYALGELYYSGIYLGKNESRAFECFICAADQGHLEAKYRLAIMYLEEVTVELNYEKAYLLLKDAADANHTLAADIFKTPMIYSLEHPSPVKLYEMFLYISKEGIAKVEYNLGSLCEYGCHNKNTHFGIPKNTQEAVDWYSIAATQHDDVRAQVRLGFLYERGGDDFETNLEASISYYLKAVDQRNPEAMYNLACIYLGKRSPKHAIPHNAATTKPLVSDPGNASSSSRSSTTVEEFIQKLKEKKNTDLETNEEKASGSSSTPPPLKKITPSLLSFNDKTKPDSSNTPPLKNTSSFGSDKLEKTESNTWFYGFGGNNSSNMKPESSNTPPPNNLSFGSDKGAKTESNTSSFSFGGGGNRSSSESSNKIHDTVNPTSTLSESQESPIVSEPTLASEYTGNYNEKESERINEPEYQNLRDAFYLLREAFGMGCRKAADYMVLSSNKSRPKDPVHIKMFEIIAQEGNVDVQFQLACFYTSLESLKAIKWFKMGAKNNMADPCYRLALLYEKEDKDENIPVIAELLQKAAKQDHAKALYKLAEMYCSGESVSKDYSKAFDYYQRASQQNHEASLSIINGKSVSNDIGFYSSFFFLTHHPLFFIRMLKSIFYYTSTLPQQRTMSIYSTC